MGFVFRDYNRACFVTAGTETSIGNDAPDKSKDNILTRGSDLLNNIQHIIDIAISSVPAWQQPTSDQPAADVTETVTVAPSASIHLERSYSRTKEDVKFIPLDIVGKSKPNCHVLVNKSTGCGVSI
jgi:hypothetical protein